MCLKQLHVTGTKKYLIARVREPEISSKASASQISSATSSKMSKLVLKTAALQTKSKSLPAIQEIELEEFKLKQRKEELKFKLKLHQANVEEQQQILMLPLMKCHLLI